MNNQIIYFFPEETGLESVTLESYHVPCVGDSVHVTQLKIHAPVGRTYNKHEKWIVEERIFCVVEPTCVINIETQQHVEVYLKQQKQQ